MKYWYDARDIKDGKIDKIPLGTKVAIRMSDRTFKGKLTRNDEDVIGIDEPKELGGTYMTKSCIVSIETNYKINNEKEQLLKEIEELHKQVEKLKDENELLMLGRQEALEIRDKYNLNNNILKSLLLKGISIDEIDNALNKINKENMIISYNEILEIFLRLKLEV